MEFQDFKIAIGGRDVNGKHTISVSAPAGRYSGTFKNPISRERLDQVLSTNRLRVGSRDHTRSRVQLQEIHPVASTDDLDVIGDELSAALFRGSVLASYSQSKGQVGVKQGLRIRISIDPEIPEYAELMSLPWEFLYDDAAQMRIELTDGRAIIRDPDVPAPPQPNQVIAPLRILVVVSQPEDYPSLNLAHEIVQLQGVNEIDGIEVKILRKATISELNDEMRNQDYHVMHFMGHGDIVEGKCALIFTGDDRKGSPVHGEQLRLALNDSVRLVVLNACETARIPDDDPFASIPTELLRRGVPAVVAMQFPISDNAALKFCEKFYRLVVDSVPVDQAIGAARKEVYFGAETKSEWGTPTLFMNSPDGVLFVMQKDEEENDKSPQVRGAQHKRKRP